MTTPTTSTASTLRCSLWCDTRLNEILKLRTLHWRRLAASLVGNYTRWADTVFVHAFDSEHGLQSSPYLPHDWQNCNDELRVRTIASFNPSIRSRSSQATAPCAAMPTRVCPRVPCGGGPLRRPWRRLWPAAERGVVAGRVDRPWPAGVRPPPGTCRVPSWSDGSRAATG